ncbi:NuA4-domain-containing protein [Exidia glandulosa HHB12029]|uniref:Chromatin modification-related protein EAF6 n=1 Tax=Exidia glandulosa HHB12029 TaxID=1314781 RepID=A0A165LP47_EXIGL|nr:NuA4-domain-containing protein [Exidia glandulosa HHB12029]
MAESSDARLQYEAARKALIEAIQKKRAADKALIALEVQIYNFEGSYLSETAQHGGGNIVTGFENYLKNQTTTRRKPEPGEQDRIFSNSSATYRESLDAHEDGQDSADDIPALKAAGATMGSRSTTRKRRATLGMRDTVSGDEVELTRSARPSKKARTGDE